MICLISFLTTSAMDLHHKDELGLYQALKRNNRPYVERCIAENPEIVNCPIQGDLPLGYVGSHGHGDLLVYLLNNGAEINGIGRQGHTALGWTLRHKEGIAEDVIFDIVKTLLERKADVNIFCKQSPLHIAVTRNYDTIVHYCCRRTHKLMHKIRSK